MGWRLAKSLETLRNQVNVAYPARSKVSDGTIGDAAHAASASDHNPNPNGVVCALDLTHDPAHGFDAHKLAEYLRTHRHPNLRYIISNARIAGWWTNWQWEPSSGHTQHVHISVGTLGVGDGQTYDRYDSTQKWDIGINQEEDMIDITGVHELFKFYFGRGANATEVARYAGKVTPTKMRSILKGTSTYKKRIELAKTGDIDLLGHLPDDIRKAYVAPVYELVTEPQYRKK